MKKNVKKCSAARRLGETFERARMRVTASILQRIAQQILNRANYHNKTIGGRLLALSRRVAKEAGKLRP